MNLMYHQSFARGSTMESFTYFIVLTTFAVGRVLCSFQDIPTALPVVLNNGYLADTHEVAAAKSAHLASFAQQSHGESYGEDHEPHHEHFKYQGPTALPVVLDNGYLADTHEVAAAKSAHLNSLAQQSYGERYGEGHEPHHGDFKYQGPTALPVVLNNGYLADTHEVAAAKSAHLTSLAQQSHGESYGEDHEPHHGDFKYQGPTAIPHVLHDGHIADTKEVAAAKAEHLSAVSKVHASAGYWQGADYIGHHSEGNDHHSGTHHEYSAQARPRVLSSGYLEDTREVSVAKQQHLQVLHSSRSVYHFGPH